MNKEFVIVDRLNSVAFQCLPLVKFRFNNIDYLVYYSYDNNNMCKVFASRIVYNGNNKYSLCNISSDEKIKISNIVSAIIVTFPSSYSKNLDINKFVNEFTENNNIFLSKDIPNLEEQSLYSNSFFANSSIDYLNYTRSFYNYVLSNVQFFNRSSLIWSIPQSKQDISINRLDDSTDSATLNSISISENDNLSNNLNVIIPINGSEASSVSNSSINMQSYNNNLDSLNKIDLSVTLPVSDNLNSVSNNKANVYSSSDFGFNFVPDDQDKSLTSNQIKNEVDNKKNAGFASNIYIIIGTICLILSSIVVATAIVIIKNLS